MNRNYDVITLLQITFILRRSRVSDFSDIIKIATMFIKTTFKDSRKLKELEAMQSISVFLDVTKVADFQ